MDTLAAFIGLAFIIGLYVLIVWAVSSAIDGRKPVKHKSFWWVFFFGLVGGIIATLLEIRDKE